MRIGGESGINISTPCGCEANSSIMYSIQCAVRSEICLFVKQCTAVDDSRADVRTIAEAGIYQNLAQHALEPFSSVVLGDVSRQWCPFLTAKKVKLEDRDEYSWIILECINTIERIMRLLNETFAFR